MKPIAFPFSLNIGIDIVHLPRIYRLITRSTSSKRRNTYLNKFIHRILCAQELKHFRHRFPQQNVESALQPSYSPDSADLIRTTDMARWLAGRFAAKEAARKAAPGGASTVSWKDVMINIEESGGGRPEVIYLKEGDVRQIGKLSISHDGEYVVAMVLAASEG
jgi:holo-[acyl-carrier protein] synthase